MNKRSLIIISIFAVALLLGGIYLTIPKQNNKGGDNRESTSETKASDEVSINDAGINIDYDYTKPSGVEYTIIKTYSTTLFGMPQLIDELYKDRSKINNIHHDISSALLNYGDTYLKKEYNKLTIIPSETKIEKDTLTGVIKLGETDDKVPFSVDIIKGQRAYVIVGEGTFVFIGGLQNVKTRNFSIEQHSFTSPSLIVSTKDKERTLNYISSVGYKIPDIAITFTGYEDPFDEN